MSQRVQEPESGSLQEPQGREAQEDWQAASGATVEGLGMNSGGGEVTQTLGDPECVLNS